MKTAKAEITAVVQCPECDLRVDITDDGNWVDLKVYGHCYYCTCPNCREQFKIEGIK